MSVSTWRMKRQACAWSIRKVPCWSKRKSRVSPRRSRRFIRARAPQVAKVGFETGPLAVWHWHELRQLGLPVACLDARHAKAALSCQINKTDRNDAFGLAQLVRMGRQTRRSGRIE